MGSSSQEGYDEVIQTQLQVFKPRLSSKDHLDHLMVASTASDSRMQSDRSTSIVAPESPAHSTTQKVEPVTGQKFIAASVSRGMDELRKRASEAASTSGQGPIGFLQHAQRQHSRSGSTLNVKSDDERTQQRTRVRDAITSRLCPGPLPCKAGCDYKTVEAYSYQPLKQRVMPHKDFNEIVMENRYFLSSSDLYAIAEYRGKNRGTDGDFDVPVDGDFVIIMTIVGEPRWAFPQVKEDNSVTTTNFIKERTQWIHDCETDSVHLCTNQKTRLDERLDRSCSLMFRDLHDLSSRDDGSPAGHKRLTLMAIKPFEQDSTRRGGADAAVYKKLNSICVVGSVIALINPRLTQRGKDNCITVKPQDIDSIVLIGYSSVYSRCTSMTAVGSHCKRFVDRRTSASRQPVCEHHLQVGVKKVQRGRQELANGTFEFGGRGGGIGGGWSNSSQSSRSGELAYGLQGGALCGRPYLASSQRQYDKDDPRSSRFLIFDTLGADKVSKEQRRRKEEAKTLLTLEARRADLSSSRPSSAQQRALTANTKPTAVPEDRLFMKMDKLRLPTFSTGVLAIRDAKKTLQERRTALSSSQEFSTNKRSHSSSQKAEHSGERDLKKARANDRQAVFGSDSEGDNVPSQSSGPQWRHSASAIKLMGFDPLSDVRSRENRLRAQSQGEDRAKRDSMSFLLSRHSSPSCSLRTPDLALKRHLGRSDSNLRPPQWHPTTTFKQPGPLKAKHLHRSSDTEEEDDLEIV